MTKCAYPEGCSNSCPKNQKYCCRDHSPYGHLCKENYVPPRKNRSIYKVQPTDPPLIRRKRIYDRKPRLEDFGVDGEENVSNDGDADSE